jgi:hypothetical protein
MKIYLRVIKDTKIPVHELVADTGADIEVLGVKIVSGDQTYYITEMIEDSGYISIQSSNGALSIRPDSSNGVTIGKNG